MSDNHTQVSPLPNIGEKFPIQAKVPETTRAELKPATSMSFYSALRAIVDDKKVTRMEWSSQDIFGFLNDGILTLSKKGVLHHWIVSDGDILATDWIIVY